MGGLDVGIMNAFFDRNFLVTVIVAVACFATIVTFGLPLLEGRSLATRMKAVSEKREELRAKHHAALNAKRSLRSDPHAFMKRTVDRFKLANLMESSEMKDKLIQAGYRGQAPMVAFLFFRFVMPFIVFLAALFYLFVITHFHWSTTMKFGAALGGALFGFYLPGVFVTNRRQNRQQSIMRAFPDALDLLLICVESGMSIESAFTKVAAEIGQSSVELAEELGLTTAELSYLPERRQAFENLAKRCGHERVKAVAASHNQAEDTA